MTQEDLAAKTGISRGHIAAMEVSRRRPSTEAISAIVAALGLSGPERDAFEDEALVARIKGKRDIAPYVMAMRSRLLRAEDSLARGHQAIGDAIRIAERMRDTMLKNGIEVPQALSESIARMAEFIAALKQQP